jgi:hypothetical protein
MSNCEENRSTEPSGPKPPADHSAGKAQGHRGKSITLLFSGGYWDGKTLRTDSADQEESLLARACYEMAHHGAIGAECSGMSDDAVTFARLHAWTAPNEAGLQGQHRYRVIERRETEWEIFVTFGQRPVGDT